MKWGSRGYVHLKGSPINPYVVPGGEDLIVGAANYPPNYRTLDSLLAAKAPQDVIDRFVETFPSYYSNILYDIVNARYLQQDTIDFGKSFTRYEKVKVYVADSTPRFLDPGTPDDELGPINVITNLENRKQKKNIIQLLFIHVK